MHITRQIDKLLTFFRLIMNLVKAVLANRAYKILVETTCNIVGKILIDAIVVGFKYVHP